MINNFTPKKYSSIYKEQINANLMLYNPLSTKGMVVLNKTAAYIYKLIDNKRNIVDIFDIVLTKDKNAKLTDLHNILINFESLDLIFIGQSKINSILSPSKHDLLAVWFHVTNQCNLRCTYCYVSKTSTIMSPDIAKKTVDKIIDSAKKNGFKKIKFKFAGGEPLLVFKQVIETVKYMKKVASINDIKVDFVIISNGVLLTEKVCKILKNNKIRLAISLDGLGKYNDKTRIFTNGLGTFKYIEKGIDNVIKYKIPFNITVTVTAKNIDNIPDLTKWFLKKNIHFGFNFFRENPNVNEVLTSDDKKLITQMKKTYKVIENNLPKYSVFNGLLDRINFIKPHLNTCGVGQNYLVIRYDGKLLSCQMTQDKEIGSIEDNDLVETMKKGNFIRPEGLTVDGKKPCNTCQWKYICGGGCPLLSKDQKGRYYVNSPYCNVYKALIPEVLKLEAKRIIKYYQN